MGSFGRGFAILVIVLDLFAIVFFAGNYIVTGSVLSSHGHHEDKKLEALLPTVETTTADAGQAAAPVVPAGPVIGDAARGAATVGKCKACHTFDKGGKNMIGPNLFGVVGKQIMHIDGFAYSAAFQGKKGLAWNEENLEHFLENPKAFISGTKMAFPGLKNPQDRADVLAYLKSLK